MSAFGIMTRLEDANDDFWKNDSFGGCGMTRLEDANDDFWKNGVWMMLMMTFGRIPFKYQRVINCVWRMRMMSDSFGA